MIFECIFCVFLLLCKAAHNFLIKQIFIVLLTYDCQLYAWHWQYSDESQRNKNSTDATARTFGLSLCFYYANLFFIEQNEPIKIQSLSTVQIPPMAFFLHLIEIGLSWKTQNEKPEELFHFLARAFRICFPQAFSRLLVLLVSIQTHWHLHCSLNKLGTFFSSTHLLLTSFC